MTISMLHLRRRVKVAMNNRRFISEAFVAFLLFVVLGSISYFGYGMTDKINDSFTLPNYITYLTLAVTILMAAGALFGGGNIWLSTQTRREVKEELRRLEEARKKADSIVIDLLYHSYAYKTVRPTSLNLAKAIRNLRNQVGNSELKEFAELLAREIEKNTDIGAQLLRLFLSPDVKEIKAAAMTLYQIGGSDVRRMIQQRLDMEKQKAAPDNDLIEFLGKIMGMLEINEQRG